jgi:hypothetical protein
MTMMVRRRVMRMMICSYAREEVLNRGTLGSRSRPSALLVALA